MSNLKIKEEISQLSFMSKQIFSFSIALSEAVEYGKDNPQCYSPALYLLSNLLHEHSEKLSDLYENLESKSDAAAGGEEHGGKEHI